MDVIVMRIELRESVVRLLSFLNELHLQTKYRMRFKLLLKDGGKLSTK
jgi:hypothetical protein